MMATRFVTIWFRHLKTDWFAVRHPALHKTPFVLTVSDHGRLVVSAANEMAENEGIHPGMVVADARALVPSIEVMDEPPGLSEKLLKGIAEWCIRYTDIVAIDLPDGIIMNVTGAPHLWGGELNYIKDINLRLKSRGYSVRATMADTIGAAWALAHHGERVPIIESLNHMETLLPMPPAALRLEMTVIERLHKLGLHQIRDFIRLPRTALRRRFGKEFLLKLDQALGHTDEPIIPVLPVEPWRERLPCLEPIITATGIEIALQKLLETLCTNLQKEGLGVRKLVFSGFRTDHKIEKVEIGTHRATHHAAHLYKLFENKITSIEPALGIELFMIEALKTERCDPQQERLWDTTCGLEDIGLAELMDRLSNRFGDLHIRRFLPAEHYLPEKSFTSATSLKELPSTRWMNGRPRPLQLLSKPQPVEVTSIIPDYPPMMFRYLGKIHKIKKADGPERIEQEWWIQKGPHRDYYSVEDEEGQRYWLFRSGHYSEELPPRWFIHGFFA